MSTGTCVICNCVGNIRQCQQCYLQSCELCNQYHKEYCKLLQEEKWHICKGHNEPVKDYCGQCHQLICKQCVVDNHYNHAMVSKENALRRIPTVIEEVDVKLVEEISAKEALSITQNEYTCFQKRVEEEEQRLQKLLSNRKTLLIQQIGGICKTIDIRNSVADEIIAQLSTLKHELGECQKDRFPIVLLHKLSKSKFVIDNCNKQKANVEVDLSTFGLNSNANVRTIFHNALINGDNTMSDSSHAGEEEMDVSSPFIQQQAVTYEAPAAAGLNDKIGEDYDSKNGERFTKQLEEMSTALTNKEKETCFMIDLTKSFSETMKQIDRMEMPIGCSSEKFQRHGNVVMDSFTEQFEAALNFMIKLKNELLTTKKDLEIKCQSVVKWTETETEDREKERMIHFEEKERLKNDIKSLESTNNSLKQQTSELQQQIYKLQQQLQENETLKKRKELDVKLQKTNELLNQKHKENVHLSNCVTNLQNCIEEKDSILNSLRKEKDDLQSRLSSIAGDKLTRGNPAITDLGDPNRPMKIGDKYGELYDNEWTDAMECIEDVKHLYPNVKKSSEIEEIIIHHLYKILMHSYYQCIDLAENQLLTTAKTLYPFMKDQDKLETFPLRKNVLEAQRQNAESLVTYILQEKVPSVDDIIQGWEYTHANKDLISILMRKSFYGKCVYLCWSMAIQDPKMHLKEELKPGSKYDKNTYKEFVESGDTVRFVVWPALFLYEGGPLLFKGVVQAYKG